jgi:hypothetical protein
LARRKFYRYGRGSNAESYAKVRKALEQCIQLYLTDKIPHPNGGICFAAGFLQGLGDRAPYYNESSLFLDLATRFNIEVRNITKGGWLFPFADIDQDVFRKWEGNGAEVRMRCILWILEQIEKYELDDGMVIPDTIWITVPVAG